MEVKISLCTVIKKLSSIVSVNGSCRKCLNCWCVFDKIWIKRVHLIIRVVHIRECCISLLVYDRVDIYKCVY